MKARFEMAGAIEIGRGNFSREVLESEVPVLVDYWAAWCGPCRALAPVIEEIARERGDSIKVGKVDVDAEPELAEAAGALSIPYVVLYRDGEPVARSVGAVPKQQLERALGLDRALESAAR